MADAKHYEVLAVDGRTGRASLTQEEWFQVFLSGRMATTPLQWLQPAGDESKRVTFLENLRGPEF